LGGIPYSPSHFPFRNEALGCLELLPSGKGPLMRILYGVHGYGRGHATRTLAVLPHLSRSHQLLVLAGGDAFPALWPEYPVVRIPTIGFAYRRKGSGPRQRSNWLTFCHNISAVCDVFWHGPTFEMVREIVAEFAPDVVIADAETWTHQVAASLHLPRISFDHIGLLAYCQAPIDPQDWLTARFDAACYRMLMGRPDRVLVSSFYDAPPLRPDVRVVGTLPRQAIRDLVASDRGHLLVYFNRGRDQLHDNLLQPLTDLGIPVHIYGSPRRGRSGRLSFLPTSELPFLEDLASCRAVVSTAGNQLVGEALFLRKPLLVIPERCVEQRMNALAVERLGIGRRITMRQFTLPTLRDFLNHLDAYRERMGGQFRDGLQDALVAFDQFLAELAPAAARTNSSSLERVVP
jgi:uncharacterized protein (TIGR00661 family)